jgi:carbonic anhydrase
MQRTHSALLSELSKGQKPPILWIGCSDSRVPETTVLGLQPGDVFVHRNIANVVTAHDLSSTAAIAFAVGSLKVQHVVLCGHRSCGGVAGALGNASLGSVLDAWIAPLRRLRAEMQGELKALDSAGKVDALVKANVRAGVHVLRENPVVLQAVKDRGLQVHGVVYDVGTGELEELDVSESSEQEQKRLDAFGLQ